MVTNRCDAELPSTPDYQKNGAWALATTQRATSVYKGEHNTVSFRNASHRSFCYHRRFSFVMVEQTGCWRPVVLPISLAVFVWGWFSPAVLSASKGGPENQLRPTAKKGQCALVTAADREGTCPLQSSLTTHLTPLISYTILSQWERTKSDTFYVWIPYQYVLRSSAQIKPPSSCCVSILPYHAVLPTSSGSTSAATLPYWARRRRKFSFL